MENQSHTLTDKRKSIFFIVLGTPLLTELACGNVPLFSIIHPLIYLLLICAYSIPVLLIRELVVRWRLGVLGLCVLGIAYAFFNEGVIARTLLMTDIPPPLPFFVGYNFFGINPAWASAIIPWHMFNSVIFPLVLVSALFPSEHGKSWISFRVGIILFAISATVGSLIHFFGVQDFPRTASKYFFFFWFVIACLAFLSRYAPALPNLSFKKDATPMRIIAPFVSGFLLEIYLFSMGILALKRTPIVFFALLIMLIFSSFYYLCKKKDWFSLPAFAFFAIGHYTAGVFFTLLFHKGNFVEILFGEMIVVAVLMFSFIRIRKNMLFLM